VFTSLVLFLAGAMLYILVIGLIFFRWVFRPMPAQTLTPTYWINMGAVAITTLAGAHLGNAASTYAFVANIEHFIAGFTLFFRATGTWWIPLLVVVFAWRHARARTPLHYDAQYSSMVFPLGMYSAATYAYARGNHLEFLLPSCAWRARSRLSHGWLPPSASGADCCAVRRQHQCRADFANAAGDAASS
jgi:tellurite resistance protein TehA-like permease